MKWIGYYIAVLVMAGMPRLVLGQAPLVPCGKTGSAEPCEFTDLFELATRVINYIVGIAFVLSFFSISVAGIMILVSGSNEGRRTQAKSILGWGIVGLAITLGAYAIVFFIQSTLGINEGFGIK
ncbi:MAG: hypothetical protein Q8P93_00230 [bacterium]|nr:hypothetical protein [bacterium]